jgi:UDPglucose 6-dehydrogenase
VYLIDRAEYEAGFNFNQKSVALLGLAFKKRTNDMRDSAALKVVETLLARGVKEIRAYDPLANESAQNYWFNPEKNHLFDRIKYFDTAKEAISGSEALYISTDWEEFRGLSRTIEMTAKPPYLVIDGRRMMPDFRTLVENGYQHISVGGTYLKPEDVAIPKSDNGVAEELETEKV